MQKSLSIYLDIARFLAALTVFLAHANYDRFTGGLPLAWRLSELGNDAVMVFFVLSGFLIAYVTETRERSALEYFSARISRLWSIGMVSLALAIAIHFVGLQLLPNTYLPAKSNTSAALLTVLPSLFFVNELWFHSIKPLSNSPYWSIGYEFWYYVIFGAIIFLRGWVRAACVLLLLALIGPKILLLLPVWFAGVWAFRTQLAVRLSITAATVLFFGSLASYATLRIVGAIDAIDEIGRYIVGDQFAKQKLKWSQYFLSSYLIGSLIALNFVAARSLASHLSLKDIPAGGVATYLASYTFSLYLFHFPLLELFSAAADHFSIGEYKRYFVVASTLAVIWILGTWAEKQKHPLRRAVLRVGIKFTRTPNQSRKDANPLL